MYRIHGHLTKKITWTLRYQGGYNNETLLIMHILSLKLPRPQKQFIGICEEGCLQ